MKTNSLSCKEETHANIDDSIIKSSQKETLLDINLDREMKFEDHVKFICKRSSQKFHVLGQIE